MTYQEFRTFADSWGLVAMGVLWAAFILWAWLPRNRNRNRAAATMIFDKDNDDG
jgi:cytochrome c oxidase cbb3-type subunit 4